MKKIATDKLTNRKLKLDRQTISVLGTDGPRPCPLGPLTGGVVEIHLAAGS